jgi:hypothetical protein
MITRGHHLFPLRVRHYTRVGALREALANDIGSRSCLHQDEAIGIVYNLWDGILGLKLCFYIISTSILSQQAFVCYSDKMSDDINQIVTKKLDNNNFHAWKFRMTNFLMGKGFWDYVEGENEDPLELPEENATTVEIKAFKDWN